MFPHLLLLASIGEWVDCGTGQSCELCIVAPINVSITEQLTIEPITPFLRCKTDRTTSLLQRHIEAHNTVLTIFKETNVPTWG